jgi:addiction module RelB/DinJ family antitoxin
MLTTNENVATIKNTVVRARINKKVKEDARLVLSELSLSFSSVLQMLLVYIAIEKKLPPEFIKEDK